MAVVGERRLTESLPEGFAHAARHTHRDAHTHMHGNTHEVVHSNVGNKTQPIEEGHKGSFLTTTLSAL